MTTIAFQPVDAQNTCMCAEKLKFNENTNLNSLRLRIYLEFEHTSLDIAWGKYKKLGGFVVKCTTTFICVYHTDAQIAIFHHPSMFGACGDGHMARHSDVIRRIYIMIAAGYRFHSGTIEFMCYL